MHELVIIETDHIDARFKHEVRQCTCKRNIEARSRNHCCRGKARSTTHSECVSTALAILHAKCRRLIMSSSMACVAPQHFPTLSHKLHDFRRKAIEKKVF